MAAIPQIISPQSQPAVTLVSKLNLFGAPQFNHSYDNFRSLVNRDNVFNTKHKIYRDFEDFFFFFFFI